MKSLLLSLGALALTTAAFAQNPDAPGQAKKTDPLPVVDALAVERTAIASAIALAKTTDLAKTPNLNAVEDLLTGLNQSKQNTAEWRMETAQRLMHVAEQIARAGKPQNVSALAGRAMQHLGAADTPARDAETRAAAKTLAAWIYERYLADAAAAKANYEAAAQLSPSNEKAKESADRLKKTDDNVKLKPVQG